MLKESYSEKEYVILLEGFWDTMKKAAFGAGKAVGNIAAGVTSGLDKIKDFGENVWNKGVELGKKAVEIGKQLYNKVAEAINTSISAIKKAPKQTWDSIKVLTSKIVDETSEMLENAKEKGKELYDSAKETVLSIYKKLADGLADTIKSLNEWAYKNASEFEKMIIEKSTEMKEVAQTLSKSANAELSKLGIAFINGLIKTKEISKKVSFFTLGLAVLPLYGAYALGKKTYETGINAGELMMKSIETIKKEAPELWNQAIEGYKEGMIKNENFIMNFDQFINERLSR